MPHRQAALRTAELLVRLYDASDLTSSMCKAMAAVTVLQITIGDMVQAGACVRSSPHVLPFIRSSSFASFASYVHLLSQLSRVCHLYLPSPLDYLMALLCVSISSNYFLL